MTQRLTIILAISLLFFFLSAASLFAQEGRGKGRLKGFVTATDKEPVEGAKIQLEYMEFNRRLITFTNEKGKFTFGGLGKGAIKIVVLKEGYAPRVIGLHVSGISNRRQSVIVLEKKSESNSLAGEAEGSALRIQFKKADALFRERRFESALVLYLDSLKQRPKLYQIRINIANCYLQLKRYDEAIREYKRVETAIMAKYGNTKGNIEIAKIYSSIGEGYMRQNKLKEAETYFKKSIEISPTDHALAYNVAEILFAAGKTDDAIKYYDMAIKINPGFAKSYMQKGYAFLNKGDTKNAKASFNMYLELASDTEEADAVREVLETL